jgi:hypothetical protein
LNNVGQHRPCAGSTTDARSFARVLKSYTDQKFDGRLAFADDRMTKQEVEPSFDQETAQ